MANFNYYDNDAERNFSNYQNKINLKSDDKNTQQLYDKILSIFDKNKNNKLDANEIRTIWDNVKVADLDNDGIITEKEASDILKKDVVLSKLKIKANELLKFLNIINTTVYRSLKKKNKKVFDKLMSDVKKTYPSNKFKIEVNDCSDDGSIINVYSMRNGEDNLVKKIRIDFNGSYCIVDWTNDGRTTTSYNEDGTSIQETKLDNNGEKKEKNLVAERIYKDITTKMFAVLPTTGKDIGKHIEDINEKNVVDVLSGYEQISNGKSLISDIMKEYGLSIDTRIKYVKQIFSALVAHCSSHGVFVDDIVKSFNKELKYQKGTLNSVNSEKLAALVRELNDRYIGKEYKPQNENVHYNGKIDKDFKQGATGDCWLVASIKAIALKPKGLKILNDSIKIDKNGNAIVTLKGVNRTYKFTKKEIYDHTEYATGDLDVRILEMAVNKYFEEENGVNGSIDIKGNKEWVAYEILTGKGHRNSFSDTYGRIPEHWFSDSQIDAFNDPNHVVCVSAATTITDNKTTMEITDSNGNPTELTTEHAYAVKRSDKNYVYLINPHDTSAEIKVDRETFKQFFNSIDEFYL